MLAVLDSGPLSILAAYAMMRRGCLVEPLIPLSESIPCFAKDQQLHLAQKLRDLVTRQSYRAFTVKFDKAFGGTPMSPLEYSGARRLVRLASMKLATEKRFKGVVFPDVAGGIAVLQREFIESSRNNPLIFQPLIGLKNEDLFGMCKDIGVPEEELLSQIELESHGSASLPPGYSKYLGETEFEQISL